MSATATQPAQLAPPISKETIGKLERAKAFIEKNFLRLPSFTDVAKITGLSPFHFHREYHAWAGVTVKEQVASLQVEEAKRLMLAGESLPTVAARCGFAHQSHFTSRFKQLVGQTPARWLRGQGK